MSNSAYLRDLVLARTLLSPDILPDVYISLHSGDPGEEGAGEVSGRGYSRQRVELGRIATATAANTNTMEYEEMPESTVTHFGVWDAQMKGRFLTNGLLTVPQQVFSGQALRWRPGELVIRVGG